MQGTAGVMTVVSPNGASWDDGGAPTGPMHQGAPPATSRGCGSLIGMCFPDPASSNDNTAGQRGNLTLNLLHTRSTAGVSTELKDAAHTQETVTAQGTAIPFFSPVSKNDTPPDSPLTGPAMTVDPLEGLCLQTEVWTTAILDGTPHS